MITSRIVVLWTGLWNPQLWRLQGYRNSNIYSIRIRSFRRNVIPVRDQKTWSRTKITFYQIRVSPSTEFHLLLLLGYMYRSITVRSECDWNHIFRGCKKSTNVTRRLKASRMIWYASYTASETHRRWWFLQSLSSHEVLWLNPNQCGTLSLKVRLIRRDCSINVWNHVAVSEENVFIHYYCDDSGD